MNTPSCLPFRNDSLCEPCAVLNLSVEKFIANKSPPPETTSYKYDPVGLNPVDLGYLDEIYSKKTLCSFCSLVGKATYDQSGNGIGHDGLDANGKRVLCGMNWQLDARKDYGHADSALSIASAPTHSGVLTRRIRIYNKNGAFPDAYIVLATNQPGKDSIPTFLGRVVDSTHADPQRMKLWIDICEMHHGSLCGSLFRSPLLVKMWLIDVDTHQVVPGTSASRYVALSYVWGNVNDSFKGSPNPLAKLGDLPRTIRDAMTLVSALGEKYLWVDSICIPQQETELLHQTIQNMDKIYGNALFTICAATGKNSEAGLPGALPNSRNLVQRLETCAGLDLIVVKPVESHIEGTAWNSRAWTFQERLLSPRCLIFVDGRVFFQCRRATWSEEMDCEANDNSWTIDMIGSPLTIFKENFVRQYSTSVQLYSVRKLSYLTDKLAAFTGLTSALSVPLRTQFHFALPTSHFDWALLWELKVPGERIAGFPSWSWCGWNGAVEWRPSTIAGTILDLQAWLDMRTWIRWYKRVAGDYQPIKTITRRKDRWSGYSESSEAFKFEEQDTRYYPSSDYTVDVDCLHFWTFSAFFTLSRQSMSEGAFKSNLNPGLHRFSLCDSQGDWCGTIILDKEWFNRVGGTFEFIAISEARDFELEEFDSWTYYVPHERGEAEWYVYYALLIEWSHGIAWRVGLAKIFKAAFRASSGMNWKEIMLG